MNTNTLEKEFDAPKIVLFSIFYIIFLLFVFAANIIWDLFQNRTWWILFWLLIVGIVVLYKTQG